MHEGGVSAFQRMVPTNWLATRAIPASFGRQPCVVSTLAEQERKLVLDALQQNNWNQSAAARQLGITRDILRYRVKRYGLVRPGAE